MGTGGPLKLPRLCNPTEACADGEESAAPIALLLVSERCTAMTSAGARCQIQSQLNNGLCIWHDPDRKDEADALRKRGAAGRPTSRRNEVKTVSVAETPGALSSLDDCVRWSGWVAKSVVVGKLDARSARECSYAIITLRGSLEKRDLARDLAKLRSDFDEFRKGRRSLKTA